MENNTNNKNEYCGIYIIEVIKGKRLGYKYVGKSKNYIQRWKYGHINPFKKNKHRNNKLQNYYNKYGLENLSFQFIFKCKKEELKYWEKFFIKCFDSRKNGFNLTDGGDDNGRRKPCIMQNMITNEIVKFDRMVDFAEKYNLNPSSVTKVVNEKSKFIGDWFNPNSKNKLKENVIIDPQGNKHIFYRPKQFCIKNNLNFTHTVAVLKGRQKSHQGWRLPGSIMQITGKDYIFISPNGIKYEGNNTSEFSRKMNLRANNMRRLLTGERRIHKGWTTIKKNN